MGFFVEEQQPGGLQERTDAALLRTASCCAQTDGFGLCLPDNHEGSSYPGADRVEGNPFENTSYRQPGDRANAVYPSQGSSIMQDGQSETEMEQARALLCAVDLPTGPEQSTPHGRH